MKLRRQNGELHYPKMLITIGTQLRHLEYKQCLGNSCIIHEQKTSHINTAGHSNTGRIVLRSTWGNGPVKVNYRLRQPQSGKSGDIRGTKINVWSRKLSRYAGSWKRFASSVPEFPPSSCTVSNLKQKLREQWNLLQNQPLEKTIYLKPPIISCKRGKFLKDKFIRSKIKL